MKQVIGISLGSKREDFHFNADFIGEHLSVDRIGTDGDNVKAVRLLRQSKRTAQAIGLGMPIDDPQVQAALRGQVPVSGGTRLGEILLEWAVRQTQVRLGDYFNNARVLFIDGMNNSKLANAMSEYTTNLCFADLPMRFGIPKLLTSIEALNTCIELSSFLPDWISSERLRLPLAIRDDWRRMMLSKAQLDATVLVAPVHLLDEFGIEELAGKTIITTTVNKTRLEHFKNAGVHMVIDAAPFLFDRALDPSLLDAMIIAASGKRPEDILDDDYLQIIGDSGMQPRIIYPNGFKRVNRFAFVIHPLSQEYFKQIKPIEMLSRIAPPLFMDSLEKALAYAPPFVYSKVEGIKSPTGVEVEGWLISVGGTPREIMSHSPEFTYRRLLDAAQLAKRLGAQIMGLGAFTKVVGDAGLTVAKRAPLPITTGNSYSASGALWAAHDALLRMRLIPIPRGKKQAQFKAMVVGATGAIGSVCARLLVQAAEEVYLVSPESAKLLMLKDSILRETPHAKLFLSSSADRHVAAMDMIVTATSGAGKKVLDIMKVKPGCVITDVARPLDLPPQEVAKRPDVLVIESGEIQLPGSVRMKNIGLPPGIAYACLAETIVLALEGRFENFTVGRGIEWEKVREIYRLGLKHGMKLAAISGVNGVFSDADIERVRDLALAARQKKRPVKPVKPLKQPRTPKRSADRARAPAASTSRLSVVRQAHRAPSTSIQTPETNDASSLAR